MDMISRPTFLQKSPSIALCTPKDFSLEGMGPAVFIPSTVLASWALGQVLSRPPLKGAGLEQDAQSEDELRSRELSDGP